MMDYIGDYAKNSNVLLELLIKNEEEEAILPDADPTFNIELFDNTGATLIHHDTLKLVDNGRYYYLYEVPLQALFGDYTVTYSCTIEGEAYFAKERFRVSEYFNLIEDSYKNVSSIMTDVGDPSRDQTNLYLMLKLIEAQNRVKVVQIVASDQTILTDDGQKTTVIVNGKPVKNATIKVFQTGGTQELVATTKTNEKGSWEVLLYKGTYKFDFFHPSGMLLKSIRRAVS